MDGQESDSVAKIVFVSLWLILMVMIYLLVKSNPLKGLGKIKKEINVKPTPTIIQITPTQKLLPPSPTKIQPTLVPTKVIQS